MRHTESMPSLYETDYHRWAMETAAALREGRLQDIDLEATAEEIEDLGKSERRATECGQSVVPAPAEDEVPTKSCWPELASLRQETA
jgi:hypothetical protein